MLVQIDSTAHTFTTHALPGILKKNFLITGIFHLVFPRANGSKEISLFRFNDIPIAGKEIFYPADTTEESGGPPPTDVGDLPKCDRSAEPDQGQTSNHTGQWQQ
ncbi:hypothetical protein M9H77_30897 [Catharanthus roseus]|uniref:Uncharacterized protein n=1 Tax=Catharanthus roseus TaxID=4058 RepID=A0ACB9ZYI7_CATRO|nr:hypothetical protein M9H77_30897 [Catharanthus roseus]